jgi:hypothetical protein
LQVFYGRYLKKLSNQTQEAMGELTKVSLSPFPPCFAHGFYYIPGCTRVALCSTDDSSFQCARPRGGKVPRPGHTCPRTSSEGGSRIRNLLRKHWLERKCDYPWASRIRSVAYSQLPCILVQISKYICVGGTLVSQGAITVGDLTSLLLYTVYVGSGLQMLT